MRIEIPEQLIQQINTHGEESYPYECCGMVLGAHRDDSQMVQMILPIKNSQDENRRRRFLITPSQYLESERIAAGHHCDLLGFYHSHPDHQAVPSDFDTAHALPWFVYIIVSVNKGRADSISAWFLSDDRSRFMEMPIERLAEVSKTV